MVGRATNLMVFSPISDAQGTAVKTGVSAARLTCTDVVGEPSCTPFQQMVPPQAPGNSATPPSFNFASGSFHFNLDTNAPDGTEWCSGVYEATVNSDSFGIHTIYFTVKGGPVAPKPCF